MVRRIRMKRVSGIRALALGGAASALLLLAGGAVAAPESPSADAASLNGTPPAPSARPFARMFGVVPAARGGAAGYHRPTASQFANTRFASGSNLVYHSGPVMHTSTTHAIYWDPSGSTMSGSYQPLLNQFLTDVGLASGSASNVYATDTQYYDGSGPIAYSSGFGGSYLDTNPIPDNCSGEYAGSGMSVTGCVLDSDIQAQVSYALTQNPTWKTGYGSMFFVFTPRNVGSCFDASSGECAYTAYCAYHSSFTSGKNEVIYANQPYTDTSGVGAPGACDSGQHPNNDWADATINVVSHEHNESITDPDGTAWFDSSGNEIGDKCAWSFGSTLGSTAYGAYNQVINGHDYYLQQEWSNASSSCVLRSGSAVAAPSISGLSPTSATVGTSVTISGANLTGASALKFNGVPASFTVLSGSQISTTVPTAATSGPVSVTTAGGTATSTGSFTVLPSISSFTPTSGPAGTRVLLSGGGFSGASSVSFNGTTASFAVSSTTSITATVPSAATSGPITVTTPSGSAASIGVFTLTAGAVNFSLSASPTSRTMRRSAQTSYSVTISPTNGFGGSVQFSLTGLPGLTSASFSPNPSATSSTLTVSTSRQSPLGSYLLTITGTSGALKHSLQVSLVIQ
jgi:hypothetical protein